MPTLIHLGHNPFSGDKMYNKIKNTKRFIPIILMGLFILVPQKSYSKDGAKNFLCPCLRDSNNQEYWNGLRGIDTLVIFISVKNSEMMNWSNLKSCSLGERSFSSEREEIVYRKENIQNNQSFINSMLLSYEKSILEVSKNLNVDRNLNIVTNYENFIREKSDNNINYALLNIVFDCEVVGENSAQYEFLINLIHVSGGKIFLGEYALLNRAANILKFVSSHENIVNELETRSANAFVRRLLKLIYSQHECNLVCK